MLGFGHATRVNQIITELLKPTASNDNNNNNNNNTNALLAPISTLLTDPTRSNDSTLTETVRNAVCNGPSSAANGDILTRTKNDSARHTIYIVSDAPQFIFQDVIALGAIYRNAKVDAGVVQPLAYSVDRHQTIDGVKKFLARREEMIQTEVAWLAQVKADCVLADAPFLPCAAASAYGIPACLITNFTFDEVYRFLQEGDSLDEDVIACAEAALEDYKKATILLRLPGYIDIPSFDQEVTTMEYNRTPPTEELDSILSDADECETKDHPQRQQRRFQQSRRSSIVEETMMGDTTPAGEGAMSPSSSIRTTVSSPNPSISGRFSSPSSCSISSADFPSSMSKFDGLTRRVIDVPLVVRMAVNTREDVLRSLGVDEETIATKKMVLVSFGGQRLKQGWGNPLPEGWIGVICGLPVEHELPPGFYRSPHGVYVPDLTRAADIVIGKLGYGTCSECIAHDTPLIYVSRPQFVEEHGLIKMMKRHGLPVEMTAEEFENGHWQRSILEADRQAQEEREGRRLFMESCDEEDDHEEKREPKVTPVNGDEEKVSMDSIAMSSTKRRKRSESISSLSASQSVKAGKMPRLDMMDEVKEAGVSSEKCHEVTLLPEAAKPAPAVWFERRIPNNGGEVCARLVEEFMDQLGVRG
ncbi:hypothetical protein BGZ94_010160 [Podila epigama]|nr:hypothetical protein BGZ94_010160 [Podila epigama]